MRAADVRELADRSFRCLPGCGFCCTFPPAVTPREEAALRGRFPRLRVVGPRADRRLGLQGGCGACVLLSRRACTAYGLRPRHCRHFPFHVHFGPEPQVHVNATCRGVEPTPGGDLTRAFQEAVLDVADPAAWARHAAEAGAVYAEFERLAREAGAWAEGARAAATPLWDGADAGRLAGGHVEGGADALWREALLPFAARRVEDRPFYLAADLRWWTFEAREGGLVRLEMQEDGSLTETDRLAVPDGWTALPAAARDAATSYVARLESRGAFRGGVYALVDDADYGLGVAAAWRLRRAQVVADLGVRAAVLRGLGVPDAALGAELERFYDSAFLDGPTVGAWL